MFQIFPASIPSGRQSLFRTSPPPFGSSSDFLIRIPSAITLSAVPHPVWNSLIVFMFFILEKGQKMRINDSICGFINVDYSAGFSLHCSKFVE